VTQMLWVNLIMDTFAALALATEPSYKEVMNNKPRGINDFIVTKIMLKNILTQGGIFLALLLGILLWFNRNNNISTYELSLFFTVFVMLQFWNMFNARTLGGYKSAFYKIKDNKAFLIIAGIILLLQIVIIEVGGEFFRTQSLKFTDWLIIIAGTSFVLWFGELSRFIKRSRKQA
ncbi:MAG: cation transporting ATPase C-terminal domain-containing protein, partial [Bacteroidales bacterium]